MAYVVHTIPLQKYNKLFKGPGTQLMELRIWKGGE